MDQSDRQTSIFASYRGMNEFSYLFELKDRSVKTPEIQADFKKNRQKCSAVFCRVFYIPWLKCKLIRYHLENLYNAFYELGETPLDGEICSRIIQCSNPGKEPPSDEFTSSIDRWTGPIITDIINKFRYELSRFPRLIFLEQAFEDYFDRIKETIWHVINEDIGGFGWNGTVDCYIKKTHFD